MKKVLIICMVTFAFGLMTACNNTNNTNQTPTEEGKETPQEIVYNDKIQNVFFGVSLGASKKEVVDGFLKQGFYENSYSTDSRLVFEKKSSRYAIPAEFYSFGGMNWKFLNVYLSNDHFQSIEFANPHKTKTSALESFNQVLSAVSAKYNLYEKPSSDTSLYKRYIGETVDKQWVMVSCYSYESVSYERWYGVALVYGDNKFVDVSDEL